MTTIGVILLGPPGAGKGTQARRLGAFFRYPRISTGDMLRKAVRKQNSLGKEAQRYIEAGELVPDALVDAMVMDRLSRPDCGTGFILDGYPRTIHQADYLNTLFPGNRWKVLAIGIRVHDEILLRRVAGRWTCSNCGKIYNLALMTDSSKSRCDECQSPLIQRKDDSADVVSERLHVYWKMTAPLVQYYESRGEYREVDGERSVEEILEILKRLVGAEKKAQHLTTQ